MSRFLSTLCLLALTCLPALAQGFQDPLLDHMAGNWLLQGTIEDKQTTHDLNADWVLNHEYIQFHEISRDKDAQGRAAYEAIVYLGWDDKRKQYDLLWLDTTSGSGLTDPVIGHGKRSGNEIPFVLNGGDGSVFHTVFIYSPSDDSWQWRMDGEEHGKMKPFARLTLKRK